MCGRWGSGKSHRERSRINNGHIVPEGKARLITRRWNLRPRYDPLIDDGGVDTCQSDVKIEAENGRQADNDHSQI